MNDPIIESLRAGFHPTGGEESDAMVPAAEPAAEPTATPVS